MKTNKLSVSFRFLRAIGLNYSEQEYGQVSLWQIVVKAWMNTRNAFLLKYCTNTVVLAPLNPLKIRPAIYRTIGCKVGKGVFIGANVSIDSGNADLIEIGDHVHIAGHSILLCHKKDLSSYFAGDDYAQLPYKKQKIVLKKGCAIGTGTLILPGVTVGEGAIVGAFSLVTKDIPDWTIAVGRPAKVVKEIPLRSDSFTKETT